MSDEHELPTASVVRCVASAARPPPWTTLHRSSLPAESPLIERCSVCRQAEPPLIDPLRSDADLMETALKKAGVKVEHKVYTGVTHEFFGMAAVVAKAKQAQALAGLRLKQALAAAKSQ